MEIFMLNYSILFLLAIISTASQASTICSSIEDTSFEGGCVITANIHYSGANELGKMLVRNFSTDDGDARFDKPIVIVAPYPSFLQEQLEEDEVTDEEVLRFVLRTSFNSSTANATLLNDYGDHDIILFAYSLDNGFFDYVQSNSFALLEGLVQINKKNNYSQANSIAIFGSSLGGIVSKYALSYAKNNDIDVNVRTWVTLDSPLRGANIPVSYQHLPRYMINTAKDFGTLGNWSVDKVVEVLTFNTVSLLSGGILLSTAATYYVDQEFAALNEQIISSLAGVQMLVQKSEATSAKQLTINHSKYKSGDLKNTLQTEMDEMPLSNHLRKVVFTETTIANNYEVDGSASNILLSTPSVKSRDFKLLSLKLKGAGDGTDDAINLFEGYAKMGRIGRDDNHEEYVLKVSDFSNFKNVNHVSGTTLNMTNTLAVEVNALYFSEVAGPIISTDQITDIDTDELIDVHTYIEPTFIPSYSSLDIDPEIYGYDLNQLKGLDNNSLEVISPFDKIHSLGSSVHGGLLSPDELELIQSELISRHDLAYLIAINSMLLQ